MFSNRARSMRAVRLVSLLARVALMITLVLGLLNWIAQLLRWSGLSVFLAHIGFPAIHELFGATGALGLLILGGLALWTRRSRALGAAGVIYALLFPVFGMTQTLMLTGSLHWLIRVAHLLVGLGAMALVQRIEKRYQRIKQSDSGAASLNGGVSRHVVA
jgi:hypothetical protein